MRTRALGASGIQASVVGYGAWAIGGWMWGGADEKSSIAAIHAALDAGITLIDTAPVYGFGHSEIVIGKALAGRRDQAIIATKCGLVVSNDDNLGAFHFRSDRQARTPYGHIMVRKYLQPASIRQELELSLKRLGTDYIDLYQTHWQDPTTPIADTMGTLLDLKREGKIRAIGACNANRAHLEEYQQFGVLDTAQEKYSMLDRSIENESLPYCREHGIAMLAYSPLGQGLLTGKIGSQRKFDEGDQRAANPRFSVENRQRIADLLAQFQAIAADRKISLSQLVIAWTLAQPGLSHALCGARTPEQARENAAAGAIGLNDNEVKFMNATVAGFQLAG
ncbi:MAG: aldo/keto reductase [Gammaproteobacteria bacterium]